MTSYATINDVITLFRPLTTEEMERTDALLPIISDELRYRASMAGRDLDEMIQAMPTLSSVAKEVTVTVVSPMATPVITPFSSTVAMPESPVV